MPQRRQKRTVSDLAPPRRLQSVLVALDLSPLSDRVMDRVALLPLAEAVSVTLLHVVPRNLPPHARAAAEKEAWKTLKQDARLLRARLAKGATIETSVKVGAPATEIARCAASMRAELIVMGRGSGGALRDAVLGSTAECVMRRGQRPVLAVRLRPRAAYARPAVALALDHDAREAVALLFRLIPPPRPRVAVIHAYDIPYYGLRDRSEDALAHLRDEYRDDATHGTAKAFARALARATGAERDVPAWTPHVRFGSPRTVVEKVVRQADIDLLVLGTRGRSGVAHAFLGSVAGAILRDVACDALVVPPRGERSR